MRCADHLQHYLEPISFLHKALADRGLLDSDFFVLKHGETASID